MPLPEAPGEVRVTGEPVERDARRSRPTSRSTAAAAGAAIGAGVLVCAAAATAWTLWSYRSGPAPGAGSEASPAPAPAAPRLPDAGAPKHPRPRSAETDRGEEATMSDSKRPKRPNPRAWLPPEPPPPRGPDAVIIPEGQLAEVLPDGLVEALEDEGPSVALDPRWAAARDDFLASMNEQWGWLILEELGKEIARRKDGAQESAKDLRQKVLLVLCRRFDEHVAKTGKAWKPDNPGGYVRGVSRHVAGDHFKVKARKPAITRGVEVEEVNDAPIRARPGGGGVPRRAHGDLRARCTGR